MDIPGSTPDSGFWNKSKMETEQHPANPPLANCELGGYLVDDLGIRIASLGVEPGNERLRI